MKESHQINSETVERQSSLCEFTCNSISELAEHNQSVHCPYSCNICFLHFSAEYKLQDHRWAEHKISSLGTSVEVGNQDNQAPGPVEPENIGATQQEPTRQHCDQDDQLLELPTPLKQPSSEEPKVLASSQDPQVEVDEVKGLEVQTNEHNRECEVCHHFFRSNMNRFSHVIRYHKALLRRCKICMRLFMFPWDFDRHLVSQHRKCKVCQQYLINEEMLQDHMELEHPGRFI